MDRLSKQGAWTLQTLTLIQKNPRTTASKLAKILQRETLPLKADVRKLKKLGLTVSFDVGYELFRVWNSGSTKCKKSDLIKRIVK